MAPRGLLPFTIPTDLRMAVAAHGGGGFHCFRPTATATVVVCLVYACHTGHGGKRRLYISRKHIPVTSYHAPHKLTKRSVHCRSYFMLTIRPLYLCHGYIETNYRVSLPDDTLRHACVTCLAVTSRTDNYLALCLPHY